MFYSRPKIEPLGWDLVAMPTRNGSKNFDAVTTDGRPVDFRFSGGWLTVEAGPAGARPDGEDMEEVLSLAISPFGTMEIYPEQICEILGLTVQGRKIETAALANVYLDFDWSGRITYWLSTHLMRDGEDARIFVKQLCDAFPGSMLVQPAWGSDARMRFRQIRFLMASDDVVTLGIGYDKSRLQTLLAAEELSWSEYENLFAYSIQFSRGDREGEDVTLSGYIREHGAAKLNLDYDVAHHRRYRIRTQYRTADAEAQSITKKLLSIIDGYFCRGLRVMSLETGVVIAETLKDAEDEKSYSKALRGFCLEKPNRYLFVGLTEWLKDQVTVKDSVFYGARPVGPG